MNALLLESLYDLWELGGCDLAAEGANGIRRQLIINLETSGLTPETGDIIRFRAVNRWDPDDEFDEWAKPLRPMSPEAERVTGTTNDDLSRCRAADAVLSDFLDFIDGAELLGDNLEFDLMFLEAAEMRSNRTPRANLAR
jgi:DNA polymerase III alpha subunit (gram-positive type)